MADAVRLISIRRGYDPREFALVVVRRRRPAARRGARARAVDPDRDRAAEPGHHLGARLPARRHPPRPLDDVPAPRRRRSTRRRSRPSSRRSRRRRASGSQPRASPTTDAAAALDRHALPRPVALAVDPGRLAARRRRARWRGSTPSTSASTTTAATARRSRSTGSSVQAIGVTPKPELAGTSATARRRRAAGERDCPLRRRARAVSSARVPARATCRPARAFEGPAVDRPARLDHARPARRRAPRSTSG